MKKLTLALTVALLLTVATAVPAFARGGPPPFQADHPASQHAPELTPGLFPVLRFLQLPPRRIPNILMPSYTTGKPR